MKPTLRSRFERFCYQHSGWGIPNLMLFIAIGNAIVYLFGYIDPSNVIYRFLCWDTAKILHGQVWRLFTYIFIPDASYLLLLAIELFFYYFIGRVLEGQWGTLRFTIYYLAGIVLTDIAALATGIGASSYYLNLSLLLAFATVMPENRVYLFMIIPLKMKYLAWFYFAMLALDMVRFAVLGGFPVGLYYALLMLVPLLNYFLFFGKDVRNVLPTVHSSPVQQFRFRQATKKQKPNPNWAAGYSSPSGAKPYHHKCTVCGRTDTDYPDLEFRYCSRCKGYYCYCQDHINNHAHIE